VGSIVSYAPKPLKMRLQRRRRRRRRRRKLRLVGRGNQRLQRSLRVLPSLRNQTAMLF
jgi:hypothetical protein